MNGEMNEQQKAQVAEHQQAIFEAVQSDVSITAREIAKLLVALERVKELPPRRRLLELSSIINYATGLLVNAIAFAMSHQIRNVLWQASNLIQQTALEEMSATAAGEFNQQ